MLQVSKNIFMFLRNK